MISGKSSETARSRSALCLLAAVQRLPQHELAAVCVVAYVQPVCGFRTKSR